MYVYAGMYIFHHMYVRMTCVCRIHDMYTDMCMPSYVCRMTWCMYMTHVHVCISYTVYDMYVPMYDIHEPVYVTYIYYEYRLTI